MSQTTTCRVCGHATPLGHKVCDECWPERALSEGVARRCGNCGAPKLVERLTPVGEVPCLLCAACQKLTG